jgi:3-oxoacyl-[acyl-carrier protein] reductase
MDLFVITGANRGIGLEIRKALLAQNKAVLSLSRSAETAGNSFSELDFRLGLDIASAAENPSRVLDWLRGKDLLIKGLVNNAGLLLNRPADQITLEEMHQMWSVNVLGALSLTQGLLPFMVPGSHVLNIGSMGGFQGSRKYPGLSGYSASKAALANLTECWAEEWADRGIRVNCLALGAVQTDMLSSAFPTYIAPLSSIEMGEYIAHFLLEGHRFYHGQILPVALHNPD